MDIAATRVLGDFSMDFCSSSEVVLSKREWEFSQTECPALTAVRLIASPERRCGGEKSSISSSGVLFLASPTGFRTPGR